MIRHMASLAILVLAGAPLRAGELDAEFGGLTPPVAAVSPATSTLASSGTAPSLAASREANSGDVSASELDGELPSQAWHRGFGGFGFGFGFGRGFGYPGFGRSFGGFGLGIGYGGLGFGGLGYGGLGYGGLGYGGLGYGGWGYGGLGYGGLGYGGWGYGGGFLLASSYRGFGFGGFPGCYYW